MGAGMGTISSSKELIACFLEEGFKLDFERITAPAKSPLPASDKAAGLEESLYQQYLDDRYKMLFYFGFVDDAKNISLSISFLHKLAAKFIARLSQNLVGQSREQKPGDVCRLLQPHRTWTELGMVPCWI